jgi:hypothetical protein
MKAGNFLACIWLVGYLFTQGYLIGVMEKAHSRAPNTKETVLCFLIWPMILGVEAHHVLKPSQPEPTEPTEPPNISEETPTEDAKDLLH